MIDFEKILKIKGKTKADLARFLEIQANNVNRVILNENITLSKIETICKFLDISIIDALRLSGYDDTPGVAPEPAQQKKKILDYKNLLLSLSDQLIELYNNKVLAPYSVVEEKEEEIRKLNREIGRLEADNERLSKENNSHNQKINTKQRASDIYNTPGSIVDSLIKQTETNPQRVQIFKAQPMEEGEEKKIRYDRDDFPIREIPPMEEKSRG